MKTDEVALGAVATVTMGTSPKGETYNFKGIGVPLLNGPTEFGAIHPICTVFTTNSKKECRTGDLLFCVRGSTTGRMNWADRSYSLGRGVCSIRGETLVDTQFIRYCLELKLDALLNLSSGATFPNLTRDHISTFSIPYPKYRSKIAAILSNYDRLIENNTRRIEILEEMARSLYDEWFVKFRFPGYEQTKMVDSELGLIPEGWSVVRLGELASFQTGKLNSNAAKPNGDYPFFTCSQEIFRTDTYSFDTECILLAGNNANGIFHIKYFKGKFDVYQRTYVIRTIDRDKASNFYLYFAIRSQLEYLKNVSTGSATKFLTLTILNDLSIMRSSSMIQKKFSNFISVVFSKIELLQIKNTNLRRTRDLLLPKLISGEVDVENLDIETEIAA